MERPYSMDLCERVVAAIERGGMCCGEAAQHFGVAASTAIKWLQRVRATGSAAPGRLVFIDETWTKTNMAPLRGWAPRGERQQTKVPYRRWNTMTFIAALRHDRISAPWLLDRPINAERFLAYVRQVLVPTLMSGDLVVADHLSSHKQGAVRQAIREASAEIRDQPCQKRPYVPCG